MYKGRYFPFSKVVIKLYDDFWFILAMSYEKPIILILNYDIHLILSYTPNVRRALDVTLMNLMSETEQLRK